METAVSREDHCLTAPGEEIVLALAGRSFARLTVEHKGLLPAAQTLPQALSALEGLAAAGRPIPAICLRGPGDPLADGAVSVAAIKALHQAYPGARLAASTLGFQAADWASALAAAGLSRVYLELHAASIEYLQCVYQWIRPGTKTLSIAEAAATLLKAQAPAVAAFQSAGLETLGYSLLLPQINDQHLPLVAARAAELGLARLLVQPDCHQLPVGAASALVNTALAACQQHIDSELVRNFPCPTDTALPGGVAQAVPGGQRNKVAVASSNGWEVNLHLGQAQQFLIYGPRADGLVCLLEQRPAPAAGTGGDRWRQLAALLEDCFLVLVSGAGDRPREVLSKEGLALQISDEQIAGLVDAAFGGGKKKTKKTAFRQK